MKLGVDLSVYEELKAYNPKYTYKNKEVDPIEFFAKELKVPYIRIRLWHHPYDEDNHPFGGGTNDLETFLKIAKKARENGMDVVLDFHYSDFFTDPSRQKVPNAWRNLNTIDEIESALYKYTYDTLKRIKDEGISLVAVQIGNEITNGMLHPFGDRYKEYDEVKGGGFKGLSRLLKAGIKASKEVFPNIKTIVHLEHSGSFDMQDKYFSSIIEEGVDFDIMGESYYPYWHGPISQLEDSLTRLKNKYHKEIWVVELGYQYLPTENPNYDEVTDQKEGDFIIGNVNGRIPSPQSKEGQKDYIEYMIKTLKRIGVEALFYWEPAWTYQKGNSWALPAGERYCGLEPGEPYNIWAIETLFDLEGRANPAVEVFRQDFVDKQ